MSLYLIIKRQVILFAHALCCLLRDNNTSLTFKDLKSLELAPVKRVIHFGFKLKFYEANFI